MSEPGIHKIYRADSQPFTMVPNEAVRDPEITPNAFRLLAYLMSHTDGYEITYQQIERQTTLKRWAINSAIDLLTAKGYLEVTRSKLPNGQWGPKDWIIKDPATVGHSTVEPSHLGPFHSGTINGLKEKQPNKKNTLDKKNTLEADFSEFWAIYPKKADKRLALRSFEKALKRASLDIILDGARKYRDDPGREDRYTKNPSTWLNADAWDNEPTARKMSNAEKAAKLAVELATRSPEKPRELPTGLGSDWVKGVDDVD